MTSGTRHAGAPWAFGVALLLLGGFLVYFAGSIETRGRGANQDPGPAAFPVALGWLLVAGGIFEVVRSFRKRAAEPSFARASGLWEVLRSIRRRTAGAESEMGKLPSTAAAYRGYVDAAVLMGATILYVAALPWLGFNIATVLFAAALMTQLGLRWWLAVLLAIALTAVIQLLFGRLFLVPLPRSEWGIPI